MANLFADSQLALLSPNTTPDCSRLLTDLKWALNRAANYNLWARLEQNHNARYCSWSWHNPYTCRKGLVPGQKTLPWLGAADLEIRLVDQIIKEQMDLCMIASKRAQPHILPADLEIDDDNRRNEADLWGNILEHYREMEEYDMARATNELCGIGQEYGHGLMFVGWKEDKRLVKKTLSVEIVDQLLATTYINPDAADSVELIAQIIVQQIDPEIAPKEARRVARALKPGEPCDYQVPITVRAAPDWRAKTPGLDIFYPPETVTIQKAQFIVETEWTSDVEMRANCVTWRDWDKKNVERVLESTQPGRASFFAGLTTGVTSATNFTWQLTSGMIGLTIGVADLTGEQAMRQWQIITVRYKATDPKTGVPVLYETTFHPDLPDAPLCHKWSVDEHAQYPYVEYKRELSAPTLWGSRGIGELSFSEQEEIRGQANMCFDNASITIMPPYTASPRSNVANDGLRPGMRVDAIANQPNAVGVLNVGGDMKPSIEVQRMALARAFDYHKLGLSDTMDPVAKQVAQQNVVNCFLLSLRNAYRMTFAVIQQFAPDEIRINSLHGMQVEISVSREEILGNFTVFCEMDVGDLDMKSVEMRLKAFAQMIVPLDNAGMINLRPALQLGLMTIYPSFARQMMKSQDDSDQDEMEAAEANLMRNLNGLESKYRTSGGNPALRIQHTQQLLSQPAVDDKGNVQVNPQTGQPMPGRAGQIYLADPAVQALVQRTMMNENMLLEQQNNSQTGKTGVKPINQGQPA